MRYWMIPLIAGLIGACASQPRSADGVTAALLVDPEALHGSEVTTASGGYIIGATDLLSINVFQVPDLSVDQARVDASGAIQMPLIGSVQAAGLTPGQLSQEIESQLAGRYLQSPRVSINVAEAASQKVTVDGAVAKPGVYLLRGQTTLLQAIAMAQGPTEIANMRSVAVFRNTPEGRMVAVFDLSAIRNGQAADPSLVGNDVVVVDTSRLAARTRQAPSGEDDVSRGQKSDG